MLQVMSPRQKKLKLSVDSLNSQLYNQFCTQQHSMFLLQSAEKAFTEKAFTEKAFVESWFNETHNLSIT